MRRADLLRAGFGGSAALAAALAGSGSDVAPAAAPSADLDAQILNLFLVLEALQEDFYREAARSGRLKSELQTFATATRAQESQHVAALQRRLGARAHKRPKTDVRSGLGSAQAFERTAIELEEAAIAAYVGQAASLTRPTLEVVATLASVEARQAAWIRDLAGESPAPRPADPARKPEAILADLRAKGLLV